VGGWNWIVVSCSIYRNQPTIYVTFLLINRAAAGSKESHQGEEQEGRFGRLRTRYERYLNFVLDRRRPVILGYFAVSALILILVAPRIGSEIFPDSNGPVLRMRLRAPIGTRIEETEPMVMQALGLIRKTVGKDNVAITSDYIEFNPQAIRSISSTSSPVVRKKLWCMSSFDLDTPMMRSCERIFASRFKRRCRS
jgi:multidrug efflux pump subunit AcrB